LQNSLELNRSGRRKNKMKTIIIFGLIAICINGCNQSTSPSDKPLTTTFTLTDTSGQTVSQFHSGEEFKLAFTVTNTTKDTLTFYRGSTAPAVIFQIMKNDSVIASSVDGYAFLAVVLGGYVAPGQSLQGEWKAPNTPAQNPKVLLNPGSYQAKVLFPNFNQAKVNPVSSITFSVSP
jgi:hypothetical protein